MAYALATAMGCLAIEAACTLLVIEGAPLSALPFHAAACAFLAILALRRRVVPSPATASVQASALLIPFLGPVAALACVVTLAIIATLKDPSARASLWHEHLFPNLAADELTERSREIGRRQSDPDGADEVESFYDVLQWGTLAEKEHVLSLVSRSFRPEFASVLRAGLALDDLGLRAQAAAGLSLLETRISGRLSALQHQCRQQAGDERRGAAVSLAEALSSAAHSGIYDEGRSREMRLEIVSLLAPLASECQGDQQIGTMLGRTLIQLGEFDRAVETLLPAVGAGDGQSALTWLLEALFKLGDFQRIGALLTRHPDQVRALIRQDGPLAPALRFWGAAA